ncbi:Ribulose-phosphate 3-epimerase, cytoplasmic isoform [Camellia lanceoleosa]|uniref:Ribulose-phosphate 3-epimerase, cytoplasmic isoform n=1 Tax=Camellia lanceoleosa TaxID=1840588 RepID=A0ACC0HEI5_9ERIC|nr:Ribulose-phosphate 3-epimerase, cytoplasmic isoform [Camellia lanceoleosa]
MRPGVALKPGTLIEDVYPLLFPLLTPQLDRENLVKMVIVMTVEPGFGGRKFMSEMMDKGTNEMPLPCVYGGFGGVIVTLLEGRTRRAKKTVQIGPIIAHPTPQNAAHLSRIYSM